MPTCENGLLRVLKNQIARLQLLALDFAAELGYLCRVVRQADAGCLAIDITDHTAAIRPAFRIGTAKAVVDIQQPQCMQHYFHGGAAKIVGVGFRSGRLWCRHFCRRSSELLLRCCHVSQVYDWRSRVVRRSGRPAAVVGVCA